MHARASVPAAEGDRNGASAQEGLSVGVREQPQLHLRTHRGGDLSADLFPPVDTQRDAGTGDGGEGDCPSVRGGHQDIRTAARGSHHKIRSASDLLGAQLVQPDPCRARRLPRRDDDFRAQHSGARGRRQHPHIPGEAEAHGESRRGGGGGCAAHLLHGFRAYRQDVL